MAKRRLNNPQDVARARVFQKKSALTVENREKNEKSPKNFKNPRSTGNFFEKSPEGQRLSKVLAARGMASRREADFLIESGLILVDGKVAVLGQRVNDSAEITILEKAQKIQKERRTIILNKPLGYVSSQPEKNYPHALSLLTAENFHGISNRGDSKNLKNFSAKGFAPAGRLDINSTGLMIYTQNGRLAQKIIGENSEIEKEYLVRVQGQMIEGGLALLCHGLKLDGVALKPARVKILNENQLHFILKEGKKRQIRRMCALVGLKVVALKRVRIGRLKLGALPVGKWRFLQDFEKI